MRRRRDGNPADTIRRPLRAPRAHAPRTAARPRGNASAGFTLLEVLAATSATALLSALLLGVWLQAVQQGNRAETERRLAALADALGQHYRAELPRIEAVPEAVLLLGAAPAAAAIADDTDLQAELLAPLRGWLPLAAGDAARDGHGTPIRLRVSAPITTRLDGVPVTYRRLAVVSAGRNQRHESPDWDRATGVLTLAGDDRAVFVDGLAILRPQVDETRRRVLRLAQALDGYAAARYLAAASRDPTIDYYAGVPLDADAEAWDDATANALRRRSLKATPGLAPAELAALGLVDEDGRDAWGGAIDFDNDADDLRHPSNPEPALRGPPYTARLRVTLPGGTTWSETLVGVY